MANKKEISKNFEKLHKGEKIVPVSDIVKDINSGKKKYYVGDKKNVVTTALKPKKSTKYLKASADTKIRNNIKEISFGQRKTVKPVIAPAATAPASTTTLLSAVNPRKFFISFFNALIFANCLLIITTLLLGFILPAYDDKFYLWDGGFNTANKEIGEFNSAPAIFLIVWQSLIACTLFCGLGWVVYKQHKNKITFFPSFNWMTALVITIFSMWFLLITVCSPVSINKDGLNANIFLISNAEGNIEFTQLSKVIMPLVATILLLVSFPIFSNFIEDSNNEFQNIFQFSIIIIFVSVASYFFKGSDKFVPIYIWSFSLVALCYLFATQIYPLLPIKNKK